MTQPFDPGDTDKRSAALRSALARARTLTRVREAYNASVSLLPLLEAVAEVPKDDLKSADALGQWNAVARSLATVRAGTADDAAVAVIETGFAAASDAAARVLIAVLGRLMRSDRPAWFPDEAAWGALQAAERARLAAIRASASLADQQERIPAAFAAVLTAVLPALRQSASVAAGDPKTAADKVALDAIAAALRMAEPVRPETAGPAFHVFAAQEQRFARLTRTASLLDPPQTEAEMAVAPIPTLAPELGTPWVVPQQAGVVRIRRGLFLVDWFANALTLVLIALLAVQTVWVSNPSWGSIGDVIAAFFIGAAGYGGLGAALQQWTGQAKDRAGTRSTETSKVGGR